jgi:hypothetical protein
MKKNLLISYVAILSATSGFAQTAVEREIITSTVDLKLEKELINDLLNRSLLNRSKVETYLRLHPTTLKSIYSNGQNILLSDIDPNGNPIYLAPHNVEGAVTIGVNHLHSGGSLGLDLEGQGITTYIWDGGYTLLSHNELLDRVTYGDAGSGTNEHATHVGGTVISKGITPSLKGMAPQGKLKSYRFNDDTVEMQFEASQGALLSNHSYGTLTNNQTSASFFGKYEENAQEFDRITNLYPYYLPVVSAGNAQGKKFNASDNDYDLITDRGLAKNVITVGAVEGVTNYTNPASVKMSSFSSWGPTDDGRIKPDVVAKGVNVVSLSNSSDNGTANLQGTSMSAPMVTGGLMLLQQLYNKERSTFMRAATLKALVLSTAKEAGNTPGPDFKFGWGLMDVKAAAESILRINQTSNFIENNLINNSTFEQDIITKSVGKLKVALCWSDPAGVPTEFSAADDARSMLINDLDIKLVSSNGTEFFPYKMNIFSFEAAATKGVNFVDNIEIVEIDAPAGNYIIKVSHKNELLNGSQLFSIVVNGAVTPTASSRNEQIESLSLFPNPASNQFNITFSAGLNADKVNVQVYNTIGQQVIQKQFDNTGNFNESVDISGLTSGLYLIKIGCGTVSSTRKLIVN